LRRSLQFGQRAAILHEVLRTGVRRRLQHLGGERARVDGPGVGFYTVYVNGGFSTDSTFKVDFFDLNRSAPRSSISACASERSCTERHSVVC
jgi:hypothetical protein